MNNDILIGILAVFGAIGKCTGVLVLRDAIRFDVLFSYIRSLYKVSFVNYCSSKIRSVESLDSEKAFGVLGRYM